MKRSKPWGGRFKMDTDRMVEAFTASLRFDRRLAKVDIRGSIAHARMLAKQRIVTAKDARAIQRGLEAIAREIDSGGFPWREDLEDVHMNIEARLIEKTGEAGKRLHTARSRNDQVATDLRIYVKERLSAIDTAAGALQKSLIGQAKRHLGAVMPGYTHLQQAQPVLFSHHLMAYVEMLARDRGRLRDAFARADVMPLGAGALAGTPFPIDRAYVAKLLGFSKVAENSIDAVSDRDFAVEFLSVSALVMVHLSRLCEELVLWSTTEFGFIELSDAFCTGSSIMPNKKNPDVAELVRAKTGRVVGGLTGLLMTLKGLPLAYNKDLQEDKEPVFDAADTVEHSLLILAQVVAAMDVRAERMRAAASGGFLTATDAADYLVEKGVPFREAHQAVGRLVARCIDEGRALDDLSTAELRKFSPKFGDDATQRLTTASSVASRRAPGGTAPGTVAAAIRRAERTLAKMKPLPV